MIQRKTPKDINRELIPQTQNYKRIDLIRQISNLAREASKDKLKKKIVCKFCKTSIMPFGIEYMIKRIDFYIYNMIKMITGL